MYVSTECVCVCVCGVYVCVYARLCVCGVCVCLCGNVLDVHSSVAGLQVSTIAPQESHVTYFMYRTSFLKTCCTMRFLSHKIPCILLIMLFF
jgi:hypothetical protein